MDVAFVSKLIKNSVVHFIYLCIKTKWGNICLLPCLRTSVCNFLLKVPTPCFLCMLYDVADAFAVASHASKILAGQPINGTVGEFLSPPPHRCVPSCTTTMAFCTAFLACEACICRNCQVSKRKDFKELS